MGKLGGLKAGFRPADITRRLDELITVARFKRSRRGTTVESGTRWVFLNITYLFVVTGLFYAAIQFSLELIFPGKFKESRIPVEKIMTFLKKKTQEYMPAEPSTAPPPVEKESDKQEESKREVVPAPALASPQVDAKTAKRTKRSRRARGKRVRVRRSKREARRPKREARSPPGIR
jgi:hypothetical protein